VFTWREAAEREFEPAAIFDEHTVGGHCCIVDQASFPPIGFEGLGAVRGFHCELDVILLKLRGRIGGDDPIGKFGAQVIMSVETGADVDSQRFRSL
jgi:hypothetical protein